MSDEATKLLRRFFKAWDESQDPTIVGSTCALIRAEEACRNYLADSQADAPAPTDIIKGAVDRFLAWPLPRDFAPDCGISFDGRKDDEWNKNKTWPIGTNLFTADQAKAMFKHCLAAPAPLPADAPQAGSRADIEARSDALRLEGERLARLYSGAAAPARDALVDRLNSEADEWARHGWKRSPTSLLREAAAALAQRDVPREPTPEMLMAASAINPAEVSLARIWHAMYDAQERSDAQRDDDARAKLKRYDIVVYEDGDWDAYESEHGEFLRYCDLQEERSDAQRDDDARPEADPQVDNSYTGQIARLRADCTARQDAARRQWEAQDANYREKCAECESLRASLQAEGRDAARKLWKAEARCHYEDGPGVEPRFVDTRHFLLWEPNLEAARVASSDIAQKYARTDAKLVDVEVMKVSSVRLPLFIDAAMNAPEPKA